MKILVAGASSATGTKLVEQLLNKGQNIKVIVRSPEKLPDFWKNNDQLEIIVASILELSDKQMSDYVSGCHSIVSCLGHNLNFKGIFGEPRKLVTEATRRLCDAAKSQ